VAHNTVVCIKAFTNPPYIQATPTITWSNPVDIVYETALSGTQRDDATGSVVGAGTHTLTATLTPTDIANYITASANVLINVTQANSTISLSNFSDTTSGTVLDNTHSDATPNTPTNVINVLQENPSQKIHQMITFVQGLATSGELTDGSSYELIAILKAAGKSLDRREINPNLGNTLAATAELKYFITDVNDQIDSGQISQTNGQKLIDSTNAVINALSNQVR